MSEAKHTPGPWIAIAAKFGGDGLGDRPLFKDGTWAILPEYHVERLPICMVDHGNDHHAPTRAKAEHDTRLIAAAPELLEALKDILREVDESLDDPRGMSFLSLASKERAAAAIAKAEARP